VQFFGRLLSCDRIQSKANLKIKTIATCELCNLDEETAQHIIFEYPFALSPSGNPWGSASRLIKV
jgi:hypothetical protein